METINQNLEEENMILKNEVEILKMQLQESNEVGKDLNRQLETANEKILTISSENFDLKNQVDKLIDEIEKLKVQSQELKNENMVKSISKPQLKKLIEPAPMYVLFIMKLLFLGLTTTATFTFHEVVSIKSQVKDQKKKATILKSHMMKNQKKERT